MSREDRAEQEVRGGLLRRHRDFRLLWCGETAGKLGAAVTSVTMPLIAVSTLQASTFEVGLLSAAAWAPWLLIGLPVGVWVDRMRRRPIMLTSAAISLVALAGVPIAALLGWLNIGLLIAVALLTGTATVFFQTAYSAYLPSILEPGDRPEGNAKLHGSASAAQIVGLGSGGLIAQVAERSTGCSSTPRRSWAPSSFCAPSDIGNHRAPRPPTGEGRRWPVESATACS